MECDNILLAGAKQSDVFRIIPLQAIMFPRMTIRFELSRGSPTKDARIRWFGETFYLKLLPVDINSTKGSL